MFLLNVTQMQVTEKRKERIQQLLQRQEELKMELAEAKGRLMINKSTWSFDCKFCL